MFPEGLFPSIDGLHLEALYRENQSITAMLAVARPNASCPLCGAPAMRVHSRYVRTATDLLMAPGYVSVFKSPFAGCFATMPPALGASLRSDLAKHYQPLLVARTV